LASATTTPAWLTARRERAVGALGAIETPTFRGTPGWEFTPIDKLDLDAYPAAPGGEATSLFDFEDAVSVSDEEHTVAACLAALARQTVGTGAFETILVADACTDRTETVARTAARRLDLALTVLAGPGAGSGPARRLGMDAAAERLEALGCRDGLIATTDADSVPAEDWLARQQAHLAAGARVVAGLIDLHPDEILRLPGAVRARRERDARQRLSDVAVQDPAAEHHHFAGASLGISVETYRRVGGMDAHRALESRESRGKLLLAAG